MDKPLILIFTLLFISIGCTQNNHKATQEKALPKSQLFEFKNDTLAQIMEVSQISKDTLKVNFKTINKLRNTECVVNGFAIHDTTGDFLKEEETVEIEKFEVIPVKYFSFSATNASVKFIIALDISTNDKLILLGPEKTSDLTLIDCLFKSVGTLRKR
jgi:hypothetical protein